MKGFRQTVQTYRRAYLALVATTTFFLVDGATFVQAHELRRQEQEQFQWALSQTFGIPVEKLRGEQRWVFDGVGEALAAQAVPHVAFGASRLRGLIQELLANLESVSSLPTAESARTHPGSSQDASGPGAMPEESEAGPQSRPISAGSKVLSLSSRPRKDSPLRRVERKARRLKSTAADVAAASSARAPASAPRQVIPKSGIAPEIVTLAESLGNSPGRIFRFVHDQVDFDPKWGAGKSSLGTLLEGSGTSWDQAWLLQELLTAAGVDARFEWGEVQISTEMLLNLTGVVDAFRAGDLLTTAGMPIVLVVAGSQVVHARMSHVWV